MAKCAIILRLCSEIACINHRCFKTIVIVIFIVLLLLMLLSAVYTLDISKLLYDHALLLALPQDAVLTYLKLA